MEAPLIVDRYRPLAELATGGFGAVVLAYDTRMQRRVAIKRLPFPHDRAGRAVVPAGLAEARTAALLNHPAIVTVHEWETDSDEAFLIMEYVDGASLADLLEDEPLDIDEAAAVVEALAAALTYAHDNGVLHLDIKPENVLVGRDGRVKVTDFGIAELSTATGHRPAAGGTPGYMPLEQLRGAEVDERTDVWALGALVFELLAGANPMAANSVEGAIFKAEVIDPPALSEFDPELPAALEPVLATALATYPEDRFDTIAEFAEELLPLLGDPAYGRQTLAEAVELLATEGEPGAGLGAWDLLARWGPAAARALGAAAGAWLAYSGLAALSLGTAAAAGGAALAGVAGALAPGLGAALGLAVLLVAMAASGAWPLALALGVSGGTVWWFAGRHNAGFAGALLTPALGAAFAAPASPLLLGFTLPPLRAALLAAWAAVITILASAASGAREPFAQVDAAWLLDPLGSRIAAGAVRDVLMTPGALAVIAGWALAALVMSFACARATRGAALAGAAVSGVALHGGYLGAQMISSAMNDPVTWTGEALLPHLMASLILSLLVIAAGAPTRAEEE